MHSFRTLAPALALILCAAVACRPEATPAPAAPVASPTASSVTASDAILEAAFTERRMKYPVDGQGTVSRILDDDLQGSRHQRFILTLTTGRTLLIAHNIDLAPRIEHLQVGDVVHFRGDYEWNDKGGVVHWTHHDPDGMHRGGWLKHRDQTYQ